MKADAERNVAVSVIVPAYNTADYIAETLASVLAQEGPELEVLVVDDGSTDRTPEVVGAIGDPRLRYLRRENSGGPAAPRNLGIAEARGEFVSFFDSDDIMAPGKLARQIAFMRERGIGMSATNFRKFVKRPDEIVENFLDRYPRFRLLRERLGGGAGIVIPGRQALDLLFYENFVGTSSVVARRDLLLAAGPFDESLQSGDDHDMWFRLARLGEVGFLDIVGHYYRIRGTGISLGSRKKVLLNRIQVIRKQLGAETTPSQRRQARRLMAEYWLGLGYEYKNERNLTCARDSFAVSFITNASFMALRALVSTWFPGLRRESFRAVRIPARK